MKETDFSIEATKFIKIGTRFERLDVHQILYIKAKDDHMEFFCKGGKTIRARITMKTLVQQLDAKKFIRIHRSFLVALQAVTALKAETLYINKVELPVGRLYKQELKQHLIRHQLVNQ
jgi:DNA-binding LytR/AlgR family response regulator